MKKLPKEAKIGDVKSLTRTVKGRRRKLTYERVKAHGRGRKLKWKIIKNEPV